MMKEGSFQFKQFTIQQDRCAMKVGTDGVLLGAWADISRHAPDTERTFTILDIGAGTGIISLMLAQRAAEAGIDFQVDAVEIDQDAAQQATENISDSPWAGHISVLPLSLQEFEQQTDKTYDLIVSNPPFYNATLKPADEGRAVARHKDALPVSDITRFACTHLNPNGRLALICPVAYDSELMTAAVLSGLHPVRICNILTKAGKPSKRRMAEFSIHNASISREQLVIRDAEGKYTDVYRFFFVKYLYKKTKVTIFAPI